MNNPLRIRDVDPVNARTQDIDVLFAERRYEYLILKRDQLQDRLRTGSLALNGGSLVALMTMLGNEGKVASWIGVDVNNAAISAICFAIGVILAGLSLSAADRVCVDESGKAFSRYMAVKSLAASYEAINTEKNGDAAKQAFDRAAVAPLVDFSYSRASIFFQKLSGSAWFVGMAVPLAASFGFK